MSTIYGASKLSLFPKNATISYASNQLVKINTTNQNVGFNFNLNLAGITQSYRLSFRVAASEQDIYNSVSFKNTIQLSLSGYQILRSSLNSFAPITTTGADILNTIFGVTNISSLNGVLPSDAILATRLNLPVINSDSLFDLTVAFRNPSGSVSRQIPIARLFVNKAASAILNDIEYEGKGDTIPLNNNEHEYLRTRVDEINALTTPSMSLLNDFQPIIGKINRLPINARLGRINNFPAT
jgi:hypothetical protein